MEKVKKGSWKNGICKQIANGLCVIVIKIFFPEYMERECKELEDQNKDGVNIFQESSDGGGSLERMRGLEDVCKVIFGITEA